MYSSGQKIIQELSFGNITKIIDEFAFLTHEKGTINLFGGEPLSREDIFEIIAYINNKKLQIGLTTNANFNDNTIIKLSKFRISRVTIDLDGGNQETHNWLRSSTGHFEKSIRNIKNLIKNNVCVNITTVLHKGNCNEIYLILQKCVELKVSSLSLYLFTPLGRGSGIKELLLSGQEWLTLKENIQKWIEIHKPSFDIIWEKAYDRINPNNSISDSLCDREKKESVNIRCDGNVYHCCLLFDIKNSPLLGNLKKDSLILISKKLQEQSLKYNQGCIALALNNYNNYKKMIDPREIIDDIVPVCPYDWIFLNQSNKSR